MANGFVNDVEQSHEVFQAIRQLGFHERGVDFFVRRRRQGQGIQTVGRHEFVEYVGAEHHCAGYGYVDVGAVESVAFRVPFDYGVDECQTASFPPSDP